MFISVYTFIRCSISLGFIKLFQIFLSLKLVLMTKNSPKPTPVLWWMLLFDSMFSMFKHVSQNSFSSTLTVLYLKIWHGTSRWFSPHIKQCHDLLSPTLGPLLSVLTLLAATWWAMLDLSHAWVLLVSLLEMGFNAGFLGIVSNNLA